MLSQVLCDCLANDWSLGRSHRIPQYIGNRIFRRLVAAISRGGGLEGQSASPVGSDSDSTLILSKLCSVMGHSVGVYYQIAWCVRSIPHTFWWASIFCVESWQCKGKKESVFLSDTVTFRANNRKKFKQTIYKDEGPNTQEAT